MQMGGSAGSVPCLTIVPVSPLSWTQVSVLILGAERMPLAFAPLVEQTFAGRFDGTSVTHLALPPAPAQNPAHGCSPPPQRRAAVESPVQPTICPGMQVVASAPAA